MTDDITISSEQATSLADVGHEEIRGILKRRKEVEESVVKFLRGVDNGMIEFHDLIAKNDDGSFHFEGKVHFEGKDLQWFQTFDFFFPCEASWIEIIYFDEDSDTSQRIKIRDKDLARSCWIKLEENL